MGAAAEATVTVLGAAAVAPPFLYLLTLTFFDKRPEPAYAVVGTFLLGALSTSALHFISPAASVLGDYALDALQLLFGEEVVWLEPDRSVATLLQAVIDIAIPEEAQLPLVGDAESGASQRLELELADDQGPAAGSFEDRLLVVITAR